MPDAIRNARRRLLGRAREAGLHLRMRPRAPGPRLLFLPSHPPIMSSLLRAWRIAEALREAGWNSLVVPPDLDQAQRRRVIRRFDPDLIFVQKSRHPLNAPEFLEGRPFVYDIDDADFLDPRLADRIERTCREARGVIAGSRYVADWCRRFNPNSRVIWTGTPVVTWAQFYPFKYMDEFALVEEVLLRARLRLPALRFRLYGWRDDADLPKLDRIRQAGIETELIPPMAYEDFQASLQDVAVGLAPFLTAKPLSRGKSFGKVLAYLDAKVPVIASDAADHALFFEPGAGVVSNDPEVWAEEIARLLPDPALRERIAGRAFERFEARLSTAAAAARVDAFLRPLLPGAPERGAPEGQAGAVPVASASR